MKKHISSLLLFMAVASAAMFSSCNNTTQPVEARVDTVLVVENPAYAETATYIDAAPGKSVVIANPITYQFHIKNYNPDDEWADECLAKTNMDALAACIFQAVIKGRLQAYDYFSEELLSVADVKAIDKKYNRKSIGQIQFEEDWYFDEKNLRFYKDVKALTWGYENHEGTKENGFVPAFRVVLPKSGEAK
ncbi:MAG: hypothetical protein J6Z01_11485 [Bacteroidales bacterium]|nr:hypothetical protein [Bacteroidales bacterium]